MILVENEDTDENKFYHRKKKFAPFGRKDDMYLETYERMFWWEI